MRRGLNLIVPTSELLTRGAKGGETDRDIGLLMLSLLHAIDYSFVKFVCAPYVSYLSAVSSHLFI